MLSSRLRYRFANRGYVRLRWPSGRTNLPTQLSYHMNQLSLYDCCLLAGLSCKSYTRRQSGISHKAIRLVASRQQKNMHRHSYHNQAHIAQVILAAGLLADEAGLADNERDILLTAALIHDYGHLGAYRNKSAYWQEALSCDQALPLLSRGGMDSRLVSLLSEMVLATSPKDTQGMSSLKGNDILSLLLDADLFASLFLDKLSVDKLTARLKYEEKLTSPHHQIRDEFLAHCKHKGLSSLAGQSLHDRLLSGMTYFGER